jgi:hypothetical protein
LLGRCWLQHAGANLAAIELDEHALGAGPCHERLIMRLTGPIETFADVRLGALRLCFNDPQDRRALDFEAVVLLEASACLPERLLGTEVGQRALDGLRATPMMKLPPARHRSQPGSFALLVTQIRRGHADVPECVCRAS